MLSAIHHTLTQICTVNVTTSLLSTEERTNFKIDEGMSRITGRQSCKCLETLKIRKSRSKSVHGSCYGMVAACPPHFTPPLSQGHVQHPYHVSAQPCWSHSLGSPLYRAKSINSLFVCFHPPPPGHLSKPFIVDTGLRLFFFFFFNL